MIDVIKGKCVSYNSSGQGIVYHENKIIYVPGLLVGEEAEIKVWRNFDGYYEGCIINMIWTVSLRSTPRCIHFGKCELCQLQHMIERAQIKFKMQYIRQIVNRLKIWNFDVSELIKTNDLYYYQNAVLVSFERHEEVIVPGVYCNNLFIPLNQCHLIDRRIINVADAFLKVINDNDFSFNIHNPYYHSGFIKQLLVKVGETSNMMMITMITRNKQFPSRIGRIITGELKKLYPDFTTLIQRYYEDGKEYEVVRYEKGYICDYIDGIKVKIPYYLPFDINQKALPCFYQTIIDIVKFKEDDQVLDLGLNNYIFSLLLCRHVRRVDYLCQDIKMMADGKYSKQSNIKFYYEEVSDFIIRQAKDNIHYDVCILDKTVIDDKLSKTLCVVKPHKIVYITRNLPALFTNLTPLLTRYNVEIIQPVNMSPQTSNVTLIIVLVRK